MDVENNMLIWTKTEKNLQDNTSGLHSGANKHYQIRIYQQSGHLHGLNLHCL